MHIILTKNTHIIINEENKMYANAFTSLYVYHRPHGPGNVRTTVSGNGQASEITNGQLNSSVV